MRVPLRLTILAVTIVATPSTSHAQTTEQMLSHCRPITTAPVSSEGVEVPQDFTSGLCWGAFAVIQDVIVVARPGEQPIFFICVPPEGTLNQLVAVFVRYAEGNPKRFHEPFFEVALDALRTSFPCSKLQ